MRRIEYKDQEYLIYTKSGMSLKDAAILRGVPVECDCKNEESDPGCAIKFPLENMYLLTPPTALEKKTLGENKLKTGWRLGCQALFR